MALRAPSPRLLKARGGVTSWTPEISFSIDAGGKRCTGLGSVDQPAPVRRCVMLLGLRAGILLERAPVPGLRVGLGDPCGGCGHAGGSKGRPSPMRLTGPWREGGCGQFPAETRPESGLRQRPRRGLVKRRPCRPCAHTLKRRSYRCSRSTPAPCAQTTKRRSYRCRRSALAHFSHTSKRISNC